MFSNDFDFAKLLDIKRLFELNPGASFKFYKGLIIFFGFLFILAIVLRIVLILKENKALKKLLRKIINLAFQTSLAGFFYIFCRAQEIYFFSSRFFLILIFLVFIGRAFFIALSTMRNYSKETKEYERKTMIKKYLPKRKK